MPGMAFTGGVVNQSSYALRMNAPAQSGWQLLLLTALSPAARTSRRMVPTLSTRCQLRPGDEPNADMTAAVKVMTSISARMSPRGPVTISAIVKSGGNTFQASLSLLVLLAKCKRFANKTQICAAPKPKYMYPGFQTAAFCRTRLQSQPRQGVLFLRNEYYKQDVDKRCLPCSRPDRGYCGKVTSRETLR